MGSTLYDGSVLAAMRALEAMAHILSVAEAQPQSESLLGARLCKDMEPLTFQVDTATAIARIMLSKISGTEPAPFSKEDITSFSDMQHRVRETIELLQASDAGSINSKTGQPITITLDSDRSAVLPSTAYAYVAGMPNFYFHVVTTYAILRNQGVPLGKADFMESFFKPYIPAS